MFRDWELGTSQHNLIGAVSRNPKIEKNLNGYCRFIRNQQQGGSEYGNQYLKE